MTSSSWSVVLKICESTWFIRLPSFIWFGGALSHFCSLTCGFFSNKENTLSNICQTLCSMCRCHGCCCCHHHCCPYYCPCYCHHVKWERGCWILNEYLFRLLAPTLKAYYNVHFLHLQILQMVGSLIFASNLVASRKIKWQMHASQVCRRTSMFFISSLSSWTLQNLIQKFHWVGRAEQRRLVYHLVSKGKRREKLSTILWSLLGRQCWNLLRQAVKI